MLGEVLPAQGSWAHSRRLDDEDRPLAMRGGVSVHPERVSRTRLARRMPPGHLVAWAKVPTEHPAADHQPTLIYI